MATITLRIPDEMKEIMDKLDEINWSAAVRNLLEEKIEEEYIRYRINLAERQIKEGKVVSHEEVKRMFSKRWKS